MWSLTLSVLRQISSKAQEGKDFWKPSKPYHVGVHWKALADHCQMNTICQGFSHFPDFLHHFVLAILATNMTGVKNRHRADCMYVKPTLVRVSSTSKSDTHVTSLQVEHSSDSKRIFIHYFRHLNVSNFAACQAYIHTRGLIHYNSSCKLREIRSRKKMEKME